MFTVNIFTILILISPLIYCQSSIDSDERIAELENFIEEAKKSVNPLYRLTYHVSAPVGWINDPNGFSFYQGKYHIFYQYYPYDSQWGPMHWGHMASEDLINWEYLPTALIPDEEMCFSGSAVVDNDRLVLMYTAHTITDYEPFYNETQYLAFSDDGVHFEKYEGNPVLAVSPNSAPDFRDPKVWKHGDHWYVIIGSKTDDERGRVLLYRSEDLIEWEFLNVLAESVGNMGYMWECPDFFELDGKYILLMSPQGIKQQGERFKNLHQTGYIVGDFNYETFEFTPIEDFKELDYGHDFYAATTTEVDGRRLLVAWFGMWESKFPEAQDGWAGALTIIRELRLDDDNRLIMEPIPEMVDLREDMSFNEISRGNFTEYDKAIELIFLTTLEESLNISLEGINGGGSVRVTWDPETKNVVLDRDGDIRQIQWEIEDNDEFNEWRLFLDTSSIELFCGCGEVVFSSRVYPLGGWKLTNNGSNDLYVLSYTLRKGVP